MQAEQLEDHGGLWLFCLWYGGTEEDVLLAVSFQPIFWVYDNKARGDVVLEFEK